MKKLELLIVIRSLDSLSHLFFSAPILDRYTITVVSYQDELRRLQSSLKHKFFDLIYLRDPFLTGIDIEHLNLKLKWLLDHFSQTRFVDHLSNIDDIYFEDKWRQYQQFADVMAPTLLLSENPHVNWSNVFVKRRISSRAKGLVFRKEDLNDNWSDYIVQDKLDVDTEYRVFAVYEQILPLATIKTIVINDNNCAQIRTHSAVIISDALRDFMQSVHKRVKFDLVGYDVVKLKSGQYKVIEINRSPQFLGYYRETHINIAEMLLCQN